MTGKLTLVGTGPGDPELVTLKAVRLIAGADVVVYPQKQGEASLCFESVKMHIEPGCELMPVDIPMAVEREPAQQAYDAIAKRMEEKLKAGQHLVYLCEGDPLFYGSAMYLLDRLRDVTEIKVVPGVTSLTATAAAIARPLAARNDVLKVLPAPLGDEVLRRELTSADSVAIIKLGRHFDRVRKLLEETGRAERAMVIESATNANERITKLSDFAHDERPYFSVILSYRGAEYWRDGNTQ